MSTNKSFSTETSDRYSRALFEVAQESKDLDKIENDLKIFYSILNANQEIQSFLQNPTQSLKNQIKAVELLAEKLNFSKKFKKFFFSFNSKKKNFFY